MTLTVEVDRSDRLIAGFETVTAQARISETVTKLLAHNEWQEWVVARLLKTDADAG